MIESILKIVVNNAIKRNDDFLKTECYQSILKYLGNEKVPTLFSLNIYQYAKNSGRNYNSCRKLVSKYKLGTLVNKKRLLSLDEMAFLDALKR